MPQYKSDIEIIKTPTLPIVDVARRAGIVRIFFVVWSLQGDHSRLLADTPERGKLVLQRP